MRIVLAAVCALICNVDAQIMSVDLGHEFFKIALMRQGAPLEIVLNPHSKRKTATAVSFLEAVRTFGDDAMPHAGKAPSKVPTFIHSQLAYNYSSEDVQPGGLWWKNFALDEKFYSYDLGYDEDRGVPTFKFGSDKEFSTEEVLANILYFSKTLAEESADGKPVKDAVVTMPSDANMRYRQAVVAAGEIAGLRVLTLVHEGSAFAVQRAVDYAPEKGSTEYGLFYNMGSRKAEVTIVQLESRQAGMVAGKTAPVVTVVGSAIDMNIGGHMVDLKIANAMLKRFQEKYKNLADGIAQSPRALKKLVSQAQKTKAVLSANRQGLFSVESLFDDTDFQTQITRVELEQMCEGMFNQLTNPIQKALDAANLTLTDMNHIELVGGAWRVPKVQQLLSDYFEQGTGRKVHLGQHLNGEEASALGAALVGANSSSSFRVKKIFFSDVSSHAYAVQVVSAAGEKNLTTLYPVGATLGSKKKLSFSLEEDFQIKLFEDGVLLSEFAITGLEDVLKGKWSEYNLTGPTKVNVAVHLESSGIIELKAPTATCEETYWANETKKVPKQTNGTNSSNQSTEAKQSEELNTTNKTSNKSKLELYDLEVIQVRKKKKHDKKLVVTTVEYRPKPLRGEALKTVKKAMEVMAAAEHEVHLVNELKNELEAMVYSARDKMEGDTLMKVSTSEQREEVTKLCNEIEEWSYEGSTEKHDYEQRLQSLRALLGPMEERALELEAREDLPDTVKEQVDEMKQIRTMIRKDMRWVNESKIEKADEKLTEFTDWWSQRQEKQKELPLSEAPAFTKAEVMEQIKKAQQEWEKLKKLKKPKETKKKDPSEDQVKETEVKDKMLLPDTIEATESKLSEVKKAKADAIENEDYDKAQEIKKEQEALTKHLAQLKEKAEL